MTTAIPGGVHLAILAGLLLACGIAWRNAQRRHERLFVGSLTVATVAEAIKDPLLDGLPAGGRRAVVHVLCLVAASLLYQAVFEATHVGLATTHQRRRLFGVIGVVGSGFLAAGAVAGTEGVEMLPDPAVAAYFIAFAGVVAGLMVAAAVSTWRAGRGWGSRPSAVVPTLVLGAFAVDASTLAGKMLVDIAADDLTPGRPDAGVFAVTLVAAAIVVMAASVTWRRARRGDDVERSLVAQWLSLPGGSTRRLDRMAMASPRYAWVVILRDLADAGFVLELGDGRKQAG